MKQKLLFLCFCLLSVISMNAAVISEEEAIEKAKKLMPNKRFLTDTESRARSNTRKQQQTLKSAPFYIINAEDDGFVIVSGDDRVQDILGYSEHGNLDRTSAPTNVQWLLNSYEDAIKSVMESDGDITSDTRSLNTSISSREEIEPLITTTWGQGTPYNALCPTFGEQCLTGCVATAMAQVINYWKWPVDGTNIVPSYSTATNKIFMPELPSTSFDWDDMTNNDIARLMLYCGQSVEMDYGVEASGAGDAVIPSVLENIFGYSNGGRKIERRYYTDSDWFNIIYEELQEKHPVLYSGVSGSDSHMFICHGYKEGRFYINWGWNGDYDGYFDLSLLNPSNYSFSNSQVAIIGIEANGEAKGSEVIADQNLHLYFTINKDTREAVVGTGVDEDIAGAICRPPLGDDWWETMENLWADVVIPSTIVYNNVTYTVTGVAKNAFIKNTDIQRVTLPETIRSIGESAFYWCINLESINIPSQVDSIAPSTFVLCRKLKKVHLPTNLRIIYNHAFSDCVGLQEINIPGKCLYIGEDAFKWCKSLHKITFEDGTEPIDIERTYEVGLDYYPIMENKEDAKPHSRGQFADCIIDSLYIGRDIQYTGESRALAPFVICSEYRTYVLGGYAYFGPSLQHLEFGNTVTAIPNYLVSGDLGRVENEIILPQSLQTIGKYAFSNGPNGTIYDIVLRNQKKLVIPNNVVSIGECAFASNYISQIVLSDNLKEIEKNAFANNCIQELTISQNVTVIDKTAFSKNQLRIVRCLPENPPVETNPFGDLPIYVSSGCGPTYRTKWGGIIIDDSDEWVTINVRTAGSLYSRLLAQERQAKDVCRLNLKGTINSDDIDVLNTMTNLYELNLSGLTMQELPESFITNKANLIHITLPNVLTKIRDEEFKEFANLTGTMTIPSSCCIVGKSAFSNTLIDTLVNSGEINIGDSAFYNCFRLSNAEILQNSIVGNYAFYGTAIQNIHIGSGCQIAERAFSSSLEVAELDGNIVSLGNDALGFSLKTIILHGMIDNIGTCNYSTLSEVYVPDIETWCNLPFVDEGFLKNYSAKLYINNELAKDIVLPSSVNTIRDYAFYGCSTLESIELPDKIKKIGKKAFEKCESLKDIHLPSALVSIDEDTFSGCESISTISLPSGLSSIGERAFKGCVGLTRLECPKSLNIIGEEAFSECAMLQEIRFSENLYMIGKNAFSDCKVLESIDVPQHVEDIDENAFSGCSSLVKVVAHWDDPITIDASVFSDISSECFLYIPIMTSTKYIKAGWDIFQNLKEAGIMIVDVNDGGSVTYESNIIVNKSEEFFFTPFKSFQLDIAPKDGFYLKNVRLNNENVTSQVNTGKLYIEEPEENMNISVVFADEKIVMGDANGDRKIDSQDVIDTANYVLKNTPETFYNYATDMNDDGIINITDIIIMRSNLNEEK